MREKVIQALTGALQAAKQKGQLKVEQPPLLTLEQPKKPEWGDLASTVAMSLAAVEQRAPHDIAQVIVDNMPDRDRIFERIEIVKPGFLNLTVKRDLWLEVLADIERQGEQYGCSDIGEGSRVLIEFVSANPTGPLHVGHGRGAALGQAMANLLRCAGYDVVNEYYVNDAGRQMRLLGESVFAKYLTLFGRDAAFPEDGYRGEYIDAVAAHLQETIGDRLLSLAPDAAQAQCRDMAGAELLGRIREDLTRFGVTFDSWFSEGSLVKSGAVDRNLEELTQRGLLFEQDGALWFRSTAFGDEKDRVVRKREGDYTYLASDIAYHRDKLGRGYDRLIDIWGADHHGYVPRMSAVVQAYGYPKDRLHVVLVQMVHLTRGGQKVEMSKRTGEFVTLREVMDEVGPDAAKFFFLMRRSDTHLDFDLELAKRQSAENPVYYVQYAHARLASLFRVAESRGITVPRPTEADLGLLQHPDELALIRKLSAYPSVVQGSAVALEPHRITFYLQELAALVHTFYFKHRILAAEGDVAEDRFSTSSGEPAPIREQVSPGITAARLAMMQAVQQVLRNGLHILGITAPERM